MNQDLSTQNKQIALVMNKTTVHSFFSTFPSIGVGLMEACGFSRDLFCSFFWYECTIHSSLLSWRLSFLRKRFNFLLTFVCSICFVRFSYPYLSGELRTVHNPFSGYLWETVSKIQSREYQNCKVLVQLSVRWLLLLYNFVVQICFVC